jgi:hypothetical protein
MTLHPLAEVFGFRYDDFSEEATRHRNKRLCPHNNKVANCTKDKAIDPLGVCSIFHSNDVVITCPVRFRQGWVIAEDAAAFFFPAEWNWTTLTEVRLLDRHGNSAGNIDVVVVAYDGTGRIVDFGSLEVQAVYISGNVRKPFAHYMSDPAQLADMEWRARDYPRPDFLSSSRKRLVPQLIYKGSILQSWNKKQAVAVDRAFMRELPTLPRVAREDADLVWLVYDLKLDSDGKRYLLRLEEVIYTRFKPALDQITTPEVGPVEDFVSRLQERLDTKLDGEENPPDAPTLQDIFQNRE